MTRSRDSDILTESNWICALKELGGEGEHVEIHHFGHWACGWWEALCIHKGSDKEAAAQVLVDALESYPVLDEEHFSEMETEVADKTWKDCYNDSERLFYLRTHWEELDIKNSFSCLLACARGDFAPWTNNGYNDFLGC